MPRMLCDRPGCDRVGEMYTIAVRARTTETVLCAEHAAGVLEVMGWGVIASPGRQRQRSNRGDTSPRSLQQLYSDE